MLLNPLLVRYLDTCRLYFKQKSLLLELEITDPLKRSLRLGTAGSLATTASLGGSLISLYGVSYFTLTADSLPRFQSSLQGLSLGSRRLSLGPRRLSLGPHP